MEKNEQRIKRLIITIVGYIFIILYILFTNIIPIIKNGYINYINEKLMPGPLSAIRAPYIAVYFLSPLFFIMFIIFLVRELTALKKLIQKKNKKK